VMGAPDVPITVDRSLNERDYGALTGLNKTEASDRYGKDQVRQWRRSYAAAPPHGESLRDTVARVLAYYVRTMLPAVMSGGTTLVVSHGNALRALVMALGGLDAARVETLDIPTGGAILYDFSYTTAIIGRAILQ
jgi:2,3-bisphosphoglycerate-dependent phosphoglycerate mutase